MEVTAIRLRGADFARADTQFEVEFEVKEKHRLPVGLDNFPTSEEELDGKARVLIIGYVLVSRQAFDPVYFEFSNEEQVFDISVTGVYSITAETPISYPSTIVENEFQVRYIARVSLKPWEANDFAEDEFILVRPVTRFDIGLYHRKLLEAESENKTGNKEKKTKKGDIVGLTAHIDDPHPFGVGETVYADFSIHANSSKPAVKKLVAKFVREVKVKVPNNAADELFEFTKVLAEHTVSVPSDGKGQVNFHITPTVPSLEGCATSVHWNVLHVHYFIIFYLDLKDGQKIEVKLPLLCKGAIDVDDKVSEEDDESLPTDISPTTYSPSLKRIAKIEHVDGDHVLLHSQESAVFPLIRAFCRGEVLIRKPTTVERSYTFIDHRTDFFHLEITSGRNELPIRFSEEAVDTFVGHKMMPMTFESPWVAIVYTCRLYGLKNEDFIEAQFEWTPSQCPGFETALHEFNRVPEAPIIRKEVVSVGANKHITCLLNLASRKAFVGEPITIHASIENNAKKRFSSVQAQLIQNVQYRIPERHDMVYKDFSRIISEHVTNEVVWEDVKLHLPERIPPTVRCDWDILDISYVLLFKAITKGITKPLIQITVPMLLGDRGLANDHSNSSLKDSHVHIEPVDDDENDYESQVEEGVHIVPVDDNENEYESQVEEGVHREESFLSHNKSVHREESFLSHNKSVYSAYTDDEVLLGPRQPTFASERLPTRRREKSNSALSPVEDPREQVLTPRHHRKKHKHHSAHKSPGQSPSVSPRRTSHHSSRKSNHLSPSKSPHHSPKKSSHHSPRKVHHRSPSKSSQHSSRTSPQRSPRKATPHHRSPRKSSQNSPRILPHHSPRKSKLHHHSPRKLPQQSPRISPHPSPRKSKSHHHSPVKVHRHSPKSPMWGNTSAPSPKQSPTHSPTPSPRRMPMPTRGHSPPTPRRSPQKLPQKDTPPIVRVIKSASRQRRRRGPSAQPRKINGVVVIPRPQWNHIKPSTRAVYGGAKTHVPNAPWKPINEGPTPGWVERLNQTRTLANANKTGGKLVDQVNGR